MEIREGYMSFLEYKTYYRIVGKKTGDKKPLVLLHGGPGSTHNYFEVLDRLAEEDGRELVMYDQLGCGNSYVENRPDLWNAGVWIEELRCIRKQLGLDEMHLLGQSWGGMLALQYVCNFKPEGLKSIVLSSTLPASWLWAEEQQRMIRLLPEEMQELILLRYVNELSVREICNITGLSRSSEYRMEREALKRLKRMLS